jgi:hypothetical protein
MLALWLIATFPRRRAVTHCLIKKHMKFTRLLLLPLFIAALSTPAAVPELIVSEGALRTIDTVELIRNGVYWWTSSACTETANLGGASYVAYADPRLISATAGHYTSLGGSSGGFKPGDIFETGLSLKDRTSGLRGSLLPDCGYGAYFVRDDEAFYYTKNRELFRKPLTSSALAPGEPLRFRLGFGNAASIPNSGQVGTESVIITLPPVSADGVLFATDTELFSYSADLPANTLTVNRTKKSGTTTVREVVTIPGVSLRKFAIADVQDTSGNYFGSELILLTPDGRLYRVGIAGGVPQLIRTGVSDFALRNETYRTSGGGGGIVLNRKVHTTTLYMAMGNPITLQGNGRLLGIDLNAGARAEFVEFDAGASFRVTSVAVDGKRIFLTRTPTSGQGNSDLLRRNAPSDTSAFNAGDLDYVTIAITREFRSLRSSGKLVYFAHVNTVQRISADAPAIRLDFQAFAIEVTQGMQNLNNTVELVSGKRVIVRGYAEVAENNTGRGPFDVPALLHVYRAPALVFGALPFVEVEGSPFLPVQAPAVGLVPTYEAARTNLNATFQFDLPEALITAGKLRFEFVLNADRSAPETGTTPLANNTSAAELTVRDAFYPTLVFAPMQYGGGAFDLRAPGSGFWNIIARAKSILPVGGFRVSIRNSVVFKPKVTLLGIKARSFDLPDNSDAALMWLSIARTLDDNPANSHYVGMFPPGATGFNGKGYTPGHSLIMRMGTEMVANAPWNSIYGGRTLAHELSHNYGFRHIASDMTCGGQAPDGPFDSLPNGATCTMGATDLENFATGVGFDPLSWSVVLPAANGDLMSYATSRWMSEYNWNRMIRLFTLSSSPPGLASQAPRNGIRLHAVGGQPLLLVHGLFNAASNTAELFPAYALSSAMFSPATIAELTDLPANLPANAPLRLQLVDANGVILVDQPAPVETLADENNNTAMIRCALPLAANARLLRLVNAGVVLAEMSISASAPVLNLDAPVIADGSVKLSWTATDADGDALYFNIQFSPDDGQTWQTLGVNYPELNYSFSTDLLPGTAAARVRVIATDGAHTAIATSEPFALPKHTPTVQITGVTDGQQFDLGSVMAAEGFGYDAEDGSLSGGALRWALTGPEIRNGTGGSLSLANLAPGVYSLVLAGTDSDGQTATQTIQFIVRALAVADGAEPFLDGLCADPGYGNTPPVRFDVRGGSYSTARFTHANGALFVCLNGLRYGALGTAGASAGLRVDTTGSGQLGANAAGFAVDENGGIYRTGGDGKQFVALASPPVGFTVVILRDDNAWSAEMRIADALLGGWSHQLGMVVVADDGNAATPPPTWPPNTDVVAPSTWSKSQAGPLAPLASDGNLLPYGNAEGLSGGDGTAVVPVPGWTVSGSLTVAKWGTPGGFPAAGDPGPEDRGLNFFSGGLGSALTTATTTVNLPASPARIDAGLVAAELSGWLGGFGSQDDAVTLTVTFLNAAGARLDSFTIGPVLARDRGNVTGLLQRSAKRIIPPTARKVEAVLSMKFTAGSYNDAYADDLSLILRDGTAAAPVNLPPIADAGASQTKSVSGSERITLDGSASSDPEGAPLTHTWSQISGPPLVFTDGGSVRPSFTPPVVTAPTTWAFQLVVNDGVQDSLPSKTQVTLTPKVSEPSTIFDNTGASFNGTEFTSSKNWLADKFCLGPQAYTLDSVAFLLNTESPANPPVVRLQIYANDPATGKPSTNTGLIMNLSGETNPIHFTVVGGTYQRLVTWTPDTPFVLAPDTCYWAVLSTDSGSVLTTATFGKPTGDAATFGRASSIDAGLSWSYVDNFSNRKMLIKGTPVADPSLSIFDNTGGSSLGFLSITSTGWLAAKFCVGIQPYQLDSLTMILANLDPTGNLHPGTFRLQIYSNDPVTGRPFASTGVIMNLSGRTNPVALPSGDSAVKWTPDTPFNLAANTCYWAVLSVDANNVFATASGTMPTGDAATLGRVSSTDSGVTWPSLDNSTNAKMLIKGTPVASPPKAIFDNSGGSENGGFGVTTTTWLASKFCLGSPSYGLDSLSLLLSNGTSTGQPTGSSALRLQIYSNDPATGKPSTDTGVIMTLSDLTNPVTLKSSQWVKWSPATPFGLAPNTCYWAVLSVENGVVVGQIASFTMPTGDAASFGRARSTTAGTTWEAPDNFTNFKMLIQGVAAPPSQEPIIISVSISGNDLHLSFPAFSGKSYVIESRSDLVTGEWAMIPGTSVIGGGGIQQLAVPIRNEQQQFFRVKQLP